MQIKVIGRQGQELFNLILSLPLVAEIEDKERLLAAWLSRVSLSKTRFLLPLKP